MIVWNEKANLDMLRMMLRLISKTGETLKVEDGLYVRAYTDSD